MFWNWHLGTCLNSKKPRTLPQHSTPPDSVRTSHLISPSSTALINDDEDLDPPCNDVNRFWLERTIRMLDNQC
ncbi:hypothetical protein CMV_010504 [Castanea mollissima]|uniref:Uncharacterized protein n=1 Tax=Castanea mollissima TaxID=60419 RepID=A0A8J4VPZ0_9ROSI|nr:hypothetical protein CMV_010504 [Castanea mollissima]